MLLTRWTPSFLPDITHIDRDMKRFVDTFFRGGQLDDGSYGGFWNPTVDIVEQDDAYVIEAELPGLTKEDVKISIEGNILTIRGEKRKEETKKDRDYHRTERAYGSFTRSFSLPASVKADKIEASYRNGILTVNLPKVEEAKPKSIEVKVH